MRKFSFFTLGFILFLLLFAGCGTKSRLGKADRKFDAGEYAAAIREYQRVYSRIPSTDRTLRSRVAFKKAECLSFLNRTQNEMWYQRAIRNNFADSIIFLRYAQALHRNAKYSDAARNYRIYLQHNPNSVLAHNGLKATEMIQEWRAKPTRYQVRRENSLYVRNTLTFSPVFQGTDSDVLYFNSTRTTARKGVPLNFVTGIPNNNLFVKRKDASGKWGRPEEVFNEELTSHTDVGAASFSPDGRTMYFTRASQKNDGNLSLEIVFSLRAGGDWTEPKPIKFFRDSTINVAHPAIAPDGVTIYFVSDAPDGLGGYDIWRGTLDADECRFITNLGPDINTPGNEKFPVVRADGTLYFSSNGHPGLGGLDIFKATSTGEGSWNVENMGIPINSNFDDFGITFEGVNERGFFSSNRGQPRGFDAIWYFELPEIEILVVGTVVDDKQNPLPDATVRLISNTGQNIRVTTRKDGTYRIRIDKGMQCAMQATSRGFLNQAAKISTVGIDGSETLTVNFTLSAVFRPVQLENVFFDFARWDITKESERGLQELLTLLSDNPNIIIELSAHTDYVGNNQANQILSERRAQSVVDYLINAGVQPGRLMAKGYGEEQPFVVDELTHSRHPFLPLNETLTEAFILSLPQDQQVIANQINRRTEFKVLRMNFR